MPRCGPLVASCLVCLLGTSASIDAVQEATVRARDAYARATDLERSGNHAAALSLLWQAAGLDPHDADVQNSLGEALARLGALDAAIDAFRKAVTERPDVQKAGNNLILALVQAGRGSEAVEQARAFIAAAPGDVNRQFTLGLAQSEQDLEGAMATFRRVLASAPRHTLARYNLALLLQRADRLPEAIEQLGRVIESDPRPEAYYTLGVIYWHLGDLDRALRALRAAVEAEPSYAAAHEALGGVLKERRDLEGAAAALRRALALQPDAPGVRVTLARVLQLDGDDRGASLELAEGERLRRRGDLEHEALVWTAVATGKLDSGNLIGALDDLRRAMAAFEPYAAAHYQMGRVLERLGEADASKAEFARAHALNPSLIAPVPYHY